MARILYSDAHCHSNPVDGLGAGRIAEKFREVGGWFIALVSLPPYHYGFTSSSIESYEKSLKLLVNEASRIREKGLKTRVLAGFHPAEIDEYFRRGLSLEEILELADKVFRLIVKYHREGLIDGIGEVGRQHYSTAPPRLVASELVMLKAFEYARDHDMIMHLHLEQGGYVTVESIRQLTEYKRISRDKVFLHHVSPSEAYWAERLSFYYTLPAKYKTLKKTLSSKPGRALIESDFIDDPRRPGVSSYPWDIPVRIKQLLDEEVIDEEYVYKVMVDNIVEAYHVEPP